MRDTSIGSGKDRPEMSLSAPGVLQESPFPNDINRTSFDMFVKFTPEAKAFITDNIRAYTEQLIMNSKASAGESHLDMVNTKNVISALDMQHPTPRSRSKKFAGIFGGIFLGAGLSALISMLIADQMTQIGLILAFGLGVAGAFLIAFDN